MRTSARLFAAQTVDELLDGAEWRMVLFARLLQEREWGPELRVQAVGAVAHDGQTAAPLWSVFCKRRHDDVTAGLDSAQNRLNVGLPLVRRGKEMKNGPVMPNVVGMPWKVHASNVAHKPGYGVRTRPQSRP